MSLDEELEEELGKLLADEELNDELDESRCDVELDDSELDDSELLRSPLDQDDASEEDPGGPSLELPSFEDEGVSDDPSDEVGGVGPLVQLEEELEELELELDEELESNGGNGTLIPSPRNKCFGGERRSRVLFDQVDDRIARTNYHIQLRLCQYAFVDN